MTGLLSLPSCETRVGAISLFGCKVSESEWLRGLRNEDRAMEEEEEEDEDDDDDDNVDERISE